MNLWDTWTRSWHLDWTSLPNLEDVTALKTRSWGVYDLSSNAKMEPSRVVTKRWTEEEHGRCSFLGICNLVHSCFISHYWWAKCGHIYKKCYQNSWVFHVEWLGQNLSFITLFTHHAHHLSRPLEDAHVISQHVPMQWDELKYHQFQHADLSVLGNSSLLIFTVQIFNFGSHIYNFLFLTAHGVPTI